LELMSAALRSQMADQPMSAEGAKEIAAMTPPSLTITDRRITRDGLTAKIYGESPSSGAGPGMAISVDGTPPVTPKTMYFRCDLVLEEGKWKYDGGKWRDRPYGKVRSGGESPRDLYAAFHSLVMVKGSLDSDVLVDYFAPSAFVEWNAQVASISEDSRKSLTHKLIAARKSEYVDRWVDRNYRFREQCPKSFSFEGSDNPSVAGGSATFSMKGEHETRLDDAPVSVNGNATLIKENDEWYIQTVTWNGATAPDR
ncbi:MAG: hypothetical protein ACREXY_10475, partial [Gammaproteobacteria bacterium]